MKKTLLLVFLFPLLLFSQTSGGPDGYGYTWVDSNDPSGPTYNWVDIESPNNQIFGLGDDNIVGSFPIENFKFYWYNTAYLSIGSNGFIAFSNPGSQPKSSDQQLDRIDDHGQHKTMTCCQSPLRATSQTLLGHPVFHDEEMT